MSYILETFQEVIWNYQEHFWRKNLPVRDIPQIFLFRNNFWGHYLVGENVKKYENIGHLVKQSHFFIIVHKLGQTVPFWGRFQLQKLWKSRKEWDYSSKSTWPFLKSIFVKNKAKVREIDPSTKYMREPLLKLSMEIVTLGISF